MKLLRGTFAFLPPPAAVEAVKTPPLDEKRRAASINPPTGRSEPRITLETHAEQSRAEPPVALVWIITMTLEEIRGQEKDMESADR